MYCQIETELVILEVTFQYWCKQLYRIMVKDFGVEVQNLLSLKSELSRVNF